MATIASPVLLAGPTASGKSAVALDLAERLGAEIVSVDSMQVYRGLEIGTAKPSVAETARVRHHLIDVAALHEPFDAAKFRTLANAALADISARGRRAILCGGTGLYFRAWLDGLGDAPPADPAVRAELERTPLPVLLAELEQCDPETHARIDRENPRRVVRAVEVIRATGKPFSAQRAAWTSGPRSPSAPRVFALRRGPEDLHARINARVEDMFHRGLVEETRRLLALGLAQNRTAMQAIGYRQVVEHLRGERDLAVTTELVKIRTRQFAKRQMTWFRRHPGVEWLDVAPAMTAGEIASVLLAKGTLLTARPSC